MNLVGSKQGPTSPRSRTIKVLSLNVWGLAHISKARRFRIGHIADRIANGDWQIVALQEIWVESDDWRMLRDRCASRLPYSKFFYSGAFGSGLAILSEFRIVATLTHPYTLNGLPIHVGHGDWFVGKAAGCVTLDIGAGALVDVFDTHTVAAGGEHGPEKNRAHRIVQAWELAKLVQISAERGRHVIALGDFNSTPSSLSISLLCRLGGLSDAFLDTHPGLRAHAVSLSGHVRGSVPDAQRCVAELGVTCDSPLNTWTAGKKLDAKARAGAGKRLDFAFYRGPTIPISGGIKETSCLLKPTECRVVFTELIPGSQMSYTDHFGLEAVFEVLPTGTASSAPRLPVASMQKNLAQTLSSAASTLSAYVLTSRQTQRSHLLGFAACVTLALALAVSTPLIGYRGFSFWAALAILLATAAGWGGTTLLYSGVVWGEWEKRAIRTVIESIELELHNISNSSSAERQNSQSNGPAQDPTGRDSRGSPSSDENGTTERSPLAECDGQQDLI